MGELGIVVECIDCGNEVCVHQQKIIGDLEAALAEAREALRPFVFTTRLIETGESLIKWEADLTPGELARARSVLASSGSGEGAG